MSTPNSRVQAGNSRIVSVLPIGFFIRFEHASTLPVHATQHHSTFL